MATYTSFPSKPTAGDIINFDYTGAGVPISVPPGKYKLECWGAEGGYRSSQSYSGKGGYSVGTLTLTQQTNLYIYAGGQGKGTTIYSGSIYNGGFNGGGKRYGVASAGGGASDVRIGTDSLYARVIVAGGGGSDGATNKNGMYGGGETGGSSTQSFGAYGYGGTQTGNTGGLITSSQPTSASGSASYCYAGFGFGGNGCYSSSGYAGAGGGGWYGGTGSYPDGSGDDDRGGGGGSGYIYTSSTASNYPSGCLLNSSYYLTDASMKAGNTSITSPAGSAETGHYGSGYVRITVIECESGLSLKVNVNNTWKETDSMFVNINNTWKEVETIFTNINGTWKEQGKTDFINFTIDGIQYQAISGMTWLEFVNSKYNTIGLQALLNSGVYNSFSDEIRRVGTANTMFSSEAIINNGQYYTYTGYDRP